MFAMKSIVVLFGFGVVLISACKKEESPDKKPDTKETKSITQNDKSDQNNKNGGGQNTASTKRPAVPLTAVPMDQLKSGWLIDVDFQDRPLGEALKELIAQIPDWDPALVVKTNEASDGFSESNNSDSAALDQKISLKLSDVSILQAIEQVCATAGFYTKFDVQYNGSDFGDVIELYPGKRMPGGIGADQNSANDPLRWSRFVGPYMIQLDELWQYPPYGVGKFSVHVSWPRLPESINAFANYNLIEITSVKSGDQDLLGQMAAFGMSSPSEESGLQRSADGRQLHGLLKGVTAIDEIRGRVELNIPTQVKTVWVDQIKSGTVVKHDGATVTLDDVTANSDQSTSVNYSIKQDGALYGMEAYAFDKDGKLLEPSSMNFVSKSWSQSGTGDGSFGYAGVAAQLAVVIITERQKFNEEFVFENIPLNQSDQQPETLPELGFGDHPAPIGIEVLGISKDEFFEKIKLKVTNHSNKDIHAVQIKMNYLDADQKVLKDSPASLYSQEFDSSVRPVLVKAGETVELEEAAHFFPDEATAAQIEIESIEFADASTWKPESE
jgi:hypothetical protein